MMDSSDKQSSLSKVIQTCASGLKALTSVFGFWARALLEAVVALFVFHELFSKFESASSPHDKEWWEEALVALSAALTVLLIEAALSVRRTGRVVSTRIYNLAGEITSSKLDIREEIAKLRNEIESIEDRITEDERIIFGHPEMRSSRQLSVVAIEKPDHIPDVLPYKPQCGAKLWEHSYSILRFDRMQDLLFSENYLQHFFALRRKAKFQYRILIVNNRPRSVDAIRSLLQISKQLRIKTFVYTKREFYEMLECLPLLTPNEEDAVKLKGILVGNPELNLMVRANEDFEEWKSGPVALESDYVLRYLASEITNQRDNVVARAPGPLGLEIGQIPFKHVTRVLGIMHAAAKKPRIGLDAFEPIVNNRRLPENYWSCDNLSRLKMPWALL